jgi:hypothetical protein
MDEDLVTKKSKMSVKNQDVVDLDDDDERSINKGKYTIVEEESHDLSQSISNTERTNYKPNHSRKNSRSNFGFLEVCIR